jgi:hypothetical protein
MFPVFLVVLALSGLAVSIVSWFTEIGCRSEIEQAEPAFAKRLFRSTGDQIIFGAGPVRVWTLFLDTAPASIRSSINLLRWVCAARLLVFFALVGCIIGMALSDVISH